MRSVGDFWVEPFVLGNMFQFGVFMFFVQFIVVAGFCVVLAVLSAEGVCNPSRV
jgi:hypothetical protein